MSIESNIYLTIQVSDDDDDELQLADASNHTGTQGDNEGRTSLSQNFPQNSYLFTQSGIYLSFYL